MIKKVQVFHAFLDIDETRKQVYTVDLKKRKTRIINLDYFFGADVIKIDNKTVWQVELVNGQEKETIFTLPFKI